MAFDEFGTLESFLTNAWYNSKKESVVWKCICIYVLSQCKIVEEPSCALCEFILLEYEEM